MPLLQLPPETLHAIFAYVGSSFFHADLRRLTVSKQWLAFALPRCLACIGLSQRTLRSLVSSGDQQTLAPLKNTLESLDLTLTGYPGPAAARYLDAYPLSLELDDVQPPGASPDPPRYETWFRVLQHDLARLAAIARQARKLRALRIRACCHAALPVPASQMEDYLSRATLQSLLSMDHLHVLVLDTTVGLRASPGERDDHGHVCPAVAALLPSLGILHLRMCRICPDALAVQGPVRSLRLREVIVNLSLLDNRPGITSAAHARRCGPAGAGMLQLQADIHKQAEALADRMAAPKTVRIVSHSLPDFRVHALDVLTGTMMVLEDGTPWNEDGKVVEDSEPESEFSDSASSSRADEE
ncbi:hypothetical protein SPI_03499 [Niveomyces insectorum RCEF 264]|uniref:F-box domain-containing protein n=1 Tax=Niveomyces insectorum RCEF 264 TaxID=1081102 RepID=A0A167W4Q9_9HYPO|nr:hypothetical protein SPI_03499 [Niveomyces insectorum RCEF 264]